MFYDSRTAGSWKIRMYDRTRCLNEEAIHSPMITKLLVYMICNKNHIVTLEQLTEAPWTDEKESENRTEH